MRSAYVAQASSRALRSAAAAAGRVGITYERGGGPPGGVARARRSPRSARRNTPRDQIRLRARRRAPSRRSPRTETSGGSRVHDDTAKAEAVDGEADSAASVPTTASRRGTGAARCEELREPDRSSRRDTYRILRLEARDADASNCRSRAAPAAIAICCPPNSTRARRHHDSQGSSMTKLVTRSAPSPRQLAGEGTRSGTTSAEATASSVPLVARRKAGRAEPSSRRSGVAPRPAAAAARLRPRRDARHAIPARRPRPRP